MDQLHFHFTCLDGTYDFEAQFNADELRYETKSTIPELESLSGTKDDPEAFRKELDLAEIEKWDRRYPAEGTPIEDAVKWQVKLIKDGKEYVTEGEESYEPYRYEHLVRALMCCDEKAEYFII